MLPIVKRELQIAARRPWTYRQRMLIGGSALTIAVFFVLSFNRSPSSGASSMFKFLSWAAFILTLLDGTRRASDALSWERREGTLGLLFLASLRPREILLSKLAIVGIQAISPVVVALPVFVLPLVMGGVTVGESARVMLTLLTAVIFALSAGLMISSMSTSAFAALGGTLGVIVATTIIPALIGWVGSTKANLTSLWFSGPTGMLVGSADTTYKIGSSPFWQGFAVSVVSSIGMLLIANRRLTAQGSFEISYDPNSLWQRLTRPKVGFTASWGGTFNSQSPALWLAERTLPGRRAFCWLIALGATICLGLTLAMPESAIMITGAMQLGFCFLAKLWLAAVAPQSLHAARRSGALELVLCTPLRPVQLVSSQMEALYGYFFAPMISICLAFPMATIIGAAITGQVLGSMEGLIGIGLLWLFLSFLDLRALTCVGLWFGLTSVRAEQATVKTILMVLIMPWLFFLVPCIGPFLGLIGFFAWPGFCIHFGSTRLNKRFAHVVAEQPPVK